MSNWFWFGLFAVVLADLLSGLVLGQGVRSQNFYVDGGCSREVAIAILEEAETRRRDLALEWFGREFPDWPRPCPISVKGLTSSGGGATSLGFDGTGPAGMSLDGRPDKLVADVVPHEVFHTLHADHYRQPLPRWLEEGMATLVESEEAQSRQRAFLIAEVLKKGRGIPFATMVKHNGSVVASSPDPTQMYGPDVLAFYAQAFSACDYLLQLGDRENLVAFAGDYAKRGGAAFDRYGMNGLGQFQTTWLEWVKAGSPRREQMSTANYQGCTPQGCYQQRGVGIGAGVSVGGWQFVQPRPRQQPKPQQVQPVQQPAGPGPELLKLAQDALKRIEALEKRPACQCDNKPLVAQINQQSQQINALLARIEVMSSSPGPAGPKGEKGDPGRPGSIDYDEVTAEVIKRLPPWPHYFKLQPHKE